MFLKEHTLVVLNLSQMEDAELMNLLAASDLAAWSELVKRYGKLVYSISFHILNNNSDTEDAVQNTFVRLKIHADKFDTTQPLKPWLSRIAGGEAIRIYNKKKNTSKKESIRMDTQNISNQLHNRDAADIVEQKEVEILVKKAIALLPETSRIALTLYYAGEMNQTEIANELGVSQVNISEKIRSGLEKVKAYLKKAGINASIAFSPQLIQESISSKTPSDEFIFKLSNSLPTETKIAQVASTSLSFGTNVVSKKKGMFLVWPLISIFAISLAVFLFLSLKTEQNPLPESPTNLINNVVITKKERIFTPIDFSNYQPMYIQKFKVQKDSAQSGDLKEQEIYTDGGEKKWKMINNSKNSTMIIREHSDINSSDGFYLAKVFTQPHLIRCKIKVYPGDKTFGFLLKLPVVTKSGPLSVMPLNSEKFQDMNIHKQMSTICTFSSELGGELDINIYIWSNKNQWRTASFYQIKGDPKKYFISCSLPHQKEEFKFGLFANCKLEGSDFEYSPLETSWNPRHEPDIQEVLSQFPVDYLPDPKN